MEIQKINWKILIEKPETVKTHDFFTAFNAWIPESPEVFVDVADYSHVHDGPLVVLAGYAVHYMLDDAGRQKGFLYSRRRPTDGTNEQRIRSSLKEFLKACQRLEGDPVFRGNLKLNTKAIIFCLPDRGLNPNNPETYKQVESILIPIFAGFYGEKKYSFTNQPQGADTAFTILIESNVSPSLGEMVAKL